MINLAKVISWLFPNAALLFGILEKLQWLLSGVLEKLQWLLSGDHVSPILHGAQTPANSSQPQVLFSPTGSTVQQMNQQLWPFPGLCLVLYCSYCCCYWKLRCRFREEIQPKLPCFGQGMVEVESQLASWSTLSLVCTVGLRWQAYA